VTASVVVSPDQINHSVTDSLTYVFAVRGSDIASTAEITISGWAESSVKNYVGAVDTVSPAATLNGVAYSYLDVDWSGVSNFVSGSCSFTGDYNICGEYPLDINHYTLNLTVPTNTAIDVILTANAGATMLGNPEGAVGAYYAYIDPFIQVDAEWAANNPGFVLAISNGIGNSPITDIPEASTWMLTLVGFGILGAACRRTSRKCPREALACSALS
jgi:hypothetical protein